jgi:hypothetical protein
MLIPTAQDAASIQYPLHICAPFFGENRRYELPKKPYVVRLSDNRPEDLILSPSFVSPRWSATLPDCSLDEILDWDFVADPDPERILGTISVTLKYVEINVSTHVEGFWD